MFSCSVNHPINPYHIQRHTIYDISVYTSKHLYSKLSNTIIADLKISFMIYDSRAPSLAMRGIVYYFRSKLLTVFLPRCFVDGIIYPDPILGYCGRFRASVIRVGVRYVSDDRAYGKRMQHDRDRDPDMFITTIELGLQYTNGRDNTISYRHT